MGSSPSPWSAQYVCLNPILTKSINCQGICLSERPCILNNLTPLRKCDSTFVLKQWSLMAEWLRQQNLRDIECTVHDCDQRSWV